MKLKPSMFTVSFVCQRIFSLLGVGNCGENNTNFRVNVDYRVLRGAYKLVCGDDITRSGYFIQIGSILGRLLRNDAGVFSGMLVVVMFRISRIGLFYPLNTHSTNRNSDVLYLDRFTSGTQTQIVRRVVGAYATVTSMITGVKTDWMVRFSPTSIVKYVNTACTDVFNVLYLRKTKVFNKGRYSRNRQFYRTGVYWCLYINIIAVIGMYFWFYRFVMNFGYLWWLFYLSLASFVIAKTLHFRLYTVSNLWNSITSDIVWFAACLNAILGGVVAGEKKTLNIVFKNFSASTSSCLWHTAGGALNNLFIKSSVYYVFIWFYNPVNYYSRSLTINPARIFLNSGKISYLSQIRELLLR